MRYNDNRCNKYKCQKNQPLGCGQPAAVRSAPEAAPAPGGPVACDGPACTGSSSRARSLRPSGRDPGHHRSPVLGFAAARDQLALFQAVEQAGDVRIAGNHAAGDLAAGQPFGRAPQDAEHVVLRWPRGPRS